ncbi:nucleotide disphospho-sugar-binding domain-containing protein [Rhodococcus koreensis]|uniref:Glycosyltransferase, MGT family n=1 Tax=Rhodococcus koreensis TaxID=99653 RepID=A0A1H4V7N8_9NOCA|nr:nucleotide disphospho-sugar-binding domain-containing protein [Rhodococcus koreensis]SEC76997.1 glycosyltransferase, MGT family [Rhodococcus koreensis]
MSSILLCSAPLTGHVQPMIAIGRQLVQDGCEVSILTGRKFRPHAERAGIRFIALPDSCDYDEASLNERFAGRARRPAFLRSRFDAERMFAAPLADQYRAVLEALERVDADTILAENLFLGMLPLIGRSPGTRPRVFGVCTSPLMATSVDTAPFGPGLSPATGRLGRLRNRVLNAGARGVVLRRAQQVAAAATRDCTGAEPPCFLLDWVLHAETAFILTTPGFEYPRSDIEQRLTFVGPILPAAPGDAPKPPWWDRLNTDRPVVLVTQGTLDNHDLGRLVEPTIDALADTGALIVATTGGRPIAAVRRDSPNLIVSEFVPFDLLLPHVDVMVTNGGWGGVHFALSHGVPLVVAGSTEDKAEVGARLARSGAGVRLRSGSPGPARIRRAVETVLRDPAYRTRAEELAAELAELDATRSISQVIIGRARSGSVG